MGYLPPAPPPEWIEVTTLGSEEREFVSGHEGARRVVDRSLQRAEIAHRAKMAVVHAQTMREARIGTALLLALVLSVIACIAQWAGLI